MACARGSVSRTREVILLSSFIVPSSMLYLLTCANPHIVFSLPDRSVSTRVGASPVLVTKEQSKLKSACRQRCYSETLRWFSRSAPFPLGTVLIPGTQQLTAKDILHRLQKSKAKCIITDDSVAPAVDSVGAECQSLKCRLLVSEGHREGWLNFRDLLK